MFLIEIGLEVVYPPVISHKYRSYTLFSSMVYPSNMLFSTAICQITLDGKCIAISIRLLIPDKLYSTSFKKRSGACPRAPAFPSEVFLRWPPAHPLPWCHHWWPSNVSAAVNDLGPFLDSRFELGKSDALMGKLGWKSEGHGAKVKLDEHGDFSPKQMDIYGRPLISACWLINS